MKRIVVALLIILTPCLAYAQWPINSSWNSIADGWSCQNYAGPDNFDPRDHHTFDSVTSTPDPPTSLRIMYPVGWPGGYVSYMCWNMLGPRQTEWYGQYYVKYSSNWDWNDVVEKQFYFWQGTMSTGDIIGLGGLQKIQFRNQYAETVNYSSNTGYDPVFQRNTWYKVKFYIKMNTPGVKDGLGKIWVNDQLVMSHTNILWLKSTDSAGDGTGKIELNPIWGGITSPKDNSAGPGDQYVWFDKTIFQNTDPIESGLLVSQNFNSWTGQVGGTWSSWNYSGPAPGIPGTKVSLVADSTTPDPPNVLQFFYPNGWDGDGWSIGGARPPLLSSGVSEFYVQYYIKFASDFQSHPVTQKVTYFWTSNRDTHQTTYLQPDVSGLWTHTLSPSRNFYSSPRFYASRGVWHKVKYYYKVNSPADSANGIIRIWVDDVLRLNMTDWVYDISSRTGDTYFHQFDIEPIYGGQCSNTCDKTHDDYIWFDKFIISTTDPGGGVPPGDTISPYTTAHSPAKSAADVPITNRVISFNVSDKKNDGTDGNVLTSSVKMTLNGTVWGCDNTSRVSCTGGTNPATQAFTYTHPTDWGYSATNQITLNASDVTGNAMVPESYQFTTEPSSGTGGWVLDWSDEFDRGGCTAGSPCAVDNTYWLWEMGGDVSYDTTYYNQNYGSYVSPNYDYVMRNGEKQWYTDDLDTISEQDGNLVIVTRYRSPGTWFDADNVSRTVTSGSIKTARYSSSPDRLLKKKVVGPYGALEARIKVPSSGTGPWPAFWSIGWGENGTGSLPWPTCGEVDIMETWTVNPTQMGTFTHVGDGSNPYAWTTIDPTQWHTYRMEWFTDRLDVYLDGVKRLTKLNGGTLENWPFFEPIDVRLGMAFGGTGRSYNTSHLPVTMLVDYVRYYTWGSPISISTSSIPDGRVGTPFSFQLTATGGTAPYSWSLDNGAIATGLVLSPAGVISGVPTTSGTYNFTAKVSSGSSAEYSDNFNRGSINPLDGNWSTVYTAEPHQIVNNQVKGVPTTLTNRSYHTGTFADNQYSSVTAVNRVGVGVSVRTQVGSDSGYTCYRSSSASTVRLMRIDNSVETIIAGPVSDPMSDGNKFRAEANDNVIRCLYDSGGGMTEILSVEDNTYASGRVGIESYGTSATMDDWNGGGTSTISTTKSLSQTIQSNVPSGQNTVTITNCQDTFINSGSDGDDNYSTLEVLRTYQWPAATPANKTIFEWNISSIPDNVVVTEALLEMYNVGYLGGGGTSSMRHHVYQVTGDVPNIVYVTWNTFNGTISSEEDVTEVPLTPGWVKFDITNMVQTVYDSESSLLYLMIDGGLDGAIDSNRAFASSEYGTSENRPRIVVTYEGQAPIPSAPGRMYIKKLVGRFH